MLNTVAITEAIKDAAAAATAAGRDEEDGGTCNLDTPAIRLPRLSRKAKDTIEHVSGVRLSKFDAWGSGWYTVLVPLLGQANRRSRMMEAAMCALQTYDGCMGDEVQVCGYYQMD